MTRSAPLQDVKLQPLPHLSDKNRPRELLQVIGMFVVCAESPLSIIMYAQLQPYLIWVDFCEKWKNFSRDDTTDVRDSFCWLCCNLHPSDPFLVEDLHLKSIQNFLASTFCEVLFMYVNCNYFACIVVGRSTIFFS